LAPLSVIVRNLLSGGRSRRLAPTRRQERAIPARVRNDSARTSSTIEVKFEIDEPKDVMETLR